jgi:hypothetical protein
MSLSCALVMVMRWLAYSICGPPASIVQVNMTTEDALDCGISLSLRMTMCV